MNFDKPPQPPGRSLVVPKDPAPHAERETGSDWMVWDFAIDSGGSAKPQAFGPGGSSIAATLNWRVAR